MVEEVAIYFEVLMFFFVQKVNFLLIQLQLNALFEVNRMYSITYSIFGFIYEMLSRNKLTISVLLGFAVTLLYLKF